MTDVSIRVLAVSFGFLTVSDAVDAQVYRTGATRSVARQTVTLRPTATALTNTGSAGVMSSATQLDKDLGCCRPVGTPPTYFAGVPTRAPAVDAVIGSMVTVLPPNCVLTVVDTVTYAQCGGVWYEPMFVGEYTTYVVVAPPTPR